MAVAVEEPAGRVVVLAALTWGSATAQIPRWGPETNGKAERSHRTD
jgi:hypothetical protein